MRLYSLFSQMAQTNLCPKLESLKHARRCIWRSAAWLALLALGLVCPIVGAQSNEWTWWGGQDQINQVGVYGTLGHPAAGNWPGVRQESAGWEDKSGNLWLFGGVGEDSVGNGGFLNDLWEYSPSTHEWTWVGGADKLTELAAEGEELFGAVGTYGSLQQPASGNVPSGRNSMASWVDGEGRFWLFGGDAISVINTSPQPVNGFNDSFLNDLWMYDPSTGLWAWIAGSNEITQTDPEGGVIVPGIYGTLGSPAKGNTPGGRMEAVTWTDKSGKLWLFGGWGFDSTGNNGPLNDLWMFDPTTVEWAWMGGSSTSGPNATGVEGVYGTQGVPSTGNIPSSTYNAVAWSDGSGNLCLFGGVGLDKEYGSSGSLDDLWEYNSTTNEWTWAYGAPMADTTPQFGTLGVLAPYPETDPGGTTSSSVWTDSSGNIWLYGGSGGTMWRFKPSALEWAWMGGGGTLPGGSPSEPAIFGVLGMSGPSVIPGDRAPGAAWTDAGGNLWLFGGDGVGPGSLGSGGLLNDLWEYTPSAGSVPPAITPTIFPPPSNGLLGIVGPVIPLNLSDPMANASIYYTTDGTNPTSSSTLYVTNGELQYTGPVGVTTLTVKAIAIASGYPNSGVLSATYSTFFQTDAVVISPGNGTYTSPQQVTLSEYTPGATIYYTTDGTTPTTSSTVYTGPINVTTTEVVEAIAVAPSYGTSGVSGADLIITPGFTLGANPTSLTINSGSKGTITLTVAPFSGFNSAVKFTCSGYPAGVTCSFNPATVTPAAGASATTQMTISASTTAELRRPHGRPFNPAVALAGLICAFVFRRRSIRHWLLIALAMVGIGWVAACGSGGGSNGGGSGSGGGGSTPTTATIGVAATAGSYSQSTSISLTIN